ncbi:MAG: DHH family phosphoesterase [Vallitaleaceae bacterium]|nr:DHH family phosphoesterase [Vallitaleaceae bacterium]
METNMKLFLESMVGARKIYIQPHNMPDPDAIASSFALHQLLVSFGVETQIIYMNVIEKVNSKKMVEMFQIDMVVKDKGFVTDPEDYVILVDSQVGNSNITNIKSEKVAVIDHHIDMGGKKYLFKDIRDHVGACSTIIAGYYKEVGLEPSKDVATALLYGIMNDTNNLTRSCDQSDLDNFYWLYGLADMLRIKRLRMNEIGREDLHAYAKALETFEVYGNIGFVHIEDCNDSLLGTISDMVYTIEGTSIVVSYAKRTDGIKFSVRSGENNIYADALVKYILKDRGVGGGHKEMAGGFIPVEEMSFLAHKELDTYVRFRAISYVEERLGVEIDRVLKN